jgi:hypothetical protein
MYRLKDKCPRRSPKGVFTSKELMKRDLPIRHLASHDAQRWTRRSNVCAIGRVAMFRRMPLSRRCGVHILRRRGSLITHLNDTKVGDGNKAKGHDHHEELSVGQY